MQMNNAKNTPASQQVSPIGAAGGRYNRMGVTDPYADAAREINVSLPRWLCDPPDMDAATEAEIDAAFLERTPRPNVIRVQFGPNRAKPLSKEQLAEIESIIGEKRGRLFDPDNHEPILRAALHLAARGFPVTSAHRPHDRAGCTSQLWRIPKKIPLGAVFEIPPFKGAVGKRPISHGWQDRASTDLRTVADQFISCRLKAKQTGREWDQKIRHLTNVSMVTGPLSGTFVVDVDGPDGIKRLAELEAEYGKLPVTLRSRSGSGKGAHIIFRLPPGIILYNSSSQFGGEGSKIDIRGENGQIIVPPSLHASGGYYVWEPGCSPDDVIVADAPGWVIRLAQEASKKGKERTAKERAERMTARASGAVADRTGATSGFENILATFGDGEGRSGFHGPIWRACWSYFASNGTDADREDLKDALIGAIEDAPVDTDRADRRPHYLQDSVLDEEIANAAQAVERERFEDAQVLAEIREYLGTLKGAGADEVTAAVSAVCEKIDDPIRREDLVKEIAKISGRSVATLRTIASKVAKAESKSGSSSAIKERLRQWNLQHALVDVEGQVVIMTEARERGRQPKLRSQANFKLWQANETFVEEDKLRPLFDRWVSWTDRRAYPDGLVFEPPGSVTPVPPGAFNTWNGFPVDGEAGDWTLLRTHLLENICEGDTKLFNFAMTWLAHVWQVPGRKPGCAFVVRGQRGVGKSKLFDWVRRALGGKGHLAVKIAKATRMTSRFNKLRMHKLLIHEEEALWAGDKEAEGEQKDLITSEDGVVEGKFAEAYEVSDYARLAKVTNELWAAPASKDGDERRFFVLTCGLKRQGDADYFAEIDAQMESGGLAAMVHEFQTWNPEPRRVCRRL